VPRTQSQRALARRAVAQDDRLPEAVRRRGGVVNAGLATLAVSVLGLGVAASAMSTSSAQDTHVATVTAPVVTTVAPGVKQPSAFQRDGSTISRSNFRAALSSTEQSDALDALALTEAAEKAAAPVEVDEKAVDSRAALLAKESRAAAKQDAKLEKKKAAAKKAAKKKAEAAKKALGVATMPVKSYSIAARFGDVGAWARYHTGFDFSAPIGTPIYAPTAGVVVHAGSGGNAAGWAGNYVVIKHADGTQTLYAHMSSISVQSGARVTGGTRLGQVGQTGRAFGPHLHFEVYPAGAEPGDVYSAVNPQPWLNKLGLKP
jgi:murein DD-endopeptidase MepM/ murein hydrolase activator NlpD